MSAKHKSILQVSIFTHQQDESRDSWEPATEEQAKQFCKATYGLFQYDGMEDEGLYLIGCHESFNKMVMTGNDVDITLDVGGDLMTATVAGYPE